MQPSTSNELDRLKAAFLAIISHELRTPLTEIVTAASILDDGYYGPLNEDQRRCLEMIQKSAANLNKIIQDLLSFAQLQADVVETLSEPTALSDLARAAIDLHRAQMEQKGMLLILRLDPDLPPIRLDRIKMARVYSNLISNAANFTREGGRIMVRTRKDGDGQALDVADNGVGIPKSRQPHVFESFYQAEDPMTRQTGGLGIGLAYARRIVEAHRGRITFESIEGRGSMFTVWLPADVDTLGVAEINKLLT
jgi:signal transduction histidine kinase